MSAGQRPAVGLLVAGAIVLVVATLIALLSVACTGLWAESGFWGWLGVMTASGLSLAFAGLNGGPRARLLATVPAGLVAGLQFGPSTGAVVALLVTGLTLRAAPRRRIAAAVALFVAAVAVGFVLVRVFSGSATC